MTFPDRRGFPGDRHFEAARQSEAYKRLKTKFEPVDTSAGLEPNVLVLGDIFDIARIYTTLSIGTEGLLPHSDNLVWLVDDAIGKLDLKDQKPFRKVLEQVRRTRGVEFLDRNNPVMDFAVNLEELMRNPFSPSGIQFEIYHAPGGLMIHRIPLNWERFEVVVSDRNLTGEPKLFGPVIAETGLPVAGNF